MTIFIFLVMAVQLENGECDRFINYIHRYVCIIGKYIC